MKKLSAYRGFWHPLATSDEVTGEPKQFELCGEKLVAFRTDKGVSVLKDRCIHRGCALSVGKLVGGNIQCPYHGWEYNEEGQCVKIPALEPDKPIPSKAKVKSYSAVEKQGVVWCSLEEPKWDVPTYPEECAYGEDGVRTILVDTFDLPVDAARAVENFLDVSHFPFVHDGSIGEGDVAVVKPHELTQDGHSFRFEYPQIQPGDPTTGGSVEVLLKFLFEGPFTLHIKREVEGTGWSNVAMFTSPVSESQSRLLLFVSRNFDLDESEDETFRSFIKGLIAEDMRIMPFTDPPWTPTDLREELHIGVPDAASVALRRMLGRIEKEAEPA